LLFYWKPFAISQLKIFQRLFSVGHTHKLGRLEAYGIKPPNEEQAKKSKKEYDISINKEWYRVKGENSNYTKFLRALIYESGQDNYLLPLGVFYSLTFRAQKGIDKISLSKLLDHLNIDISDRSKRKGRLIKGIEPALNRLVELGMLESFSLDGDMLTVTGSKEYMKELKKENKKGRLDGEKGRLDGEKGRLDGEK
jgi:hypothetical protein